MGRAARSRSTSTVKPPTRCSRFTRSRARTSRPSRPARTRRADARHKTDTVGAGPMRPGPHGFRGEESGLLATFLSQIVNGLVFGSLIGLIALGYTMVYGIIQLI